MNKIDQQLTELGSAKRKGLMTHTVIGYPDLETTVGLVQDMAAAGADFVELQIPFSDPIADGPTIQHACEAALARGTRVRDAFRVARKLSKTVDIPLLFMTYYNIVQKYGVELFCADSARAGIAGLIVPDLPLEAAAHEGFLAACRQHGLYNILVLAPTSTDQRLQKNAAAAQGFVYCMSRQGLTGAQQGFEPELQKYLGRVRAHIDVPLALGFGISNPERLRDVLPFADIAVVGSAIIDIIAASKPGEIRANVKRFIASLSQETKQGFNAVNKV